MSYTVELERGPMDGDTVNSTKAYVDEGEVILIYVFRGVEEGRYCVDEVEGLKARARWVPNDGFLLV